MNTHGKTWGYRTNSARHTHRCVNSSLDWDGGGRGKEKRQSDIGSSSGLGDERWPPLMSQDCPLEFTSPDPSYLTVQCQSLLFPLLLTYIIYTTAICSGWIRLQQWQHTLTSALPTVKLVFSLPNLWPHITSCLPVGGRHWVRFCDVIVLLGDSCSLLKCDWCTTMWLVISPSKWGNVGETNWKYSIISESAQKA